MTEIESVVVQFSGGVGSWGAAKRAVEQYGLERVTLLFADTLIEDEDLYRYLDEAAENVGAPLVKIAEGRDPWQIFFDHRFLGNTRIDPCSQILKRKLMRKWLEEHHDPERTVIVLGFDWSEVHRLEVAAPRWKPWKAVAPLTDRPYRSKDELLDDLRDQGIAAPRLYAMGFEHNNCGGFCIKAGQAPFERLYRTMPDRYRYHERREQELREFLGKDVAILRDRRGGVTRPLTLREFRERLEADPTLFDEGDVGSCSCMVPIEGEE